MSYILDALKKSERERPPGTAPDLFTVHGPQSDPPTPRWSTRAILAVVLLLAVPAIGLLAWIGTGRRDESAVRPPVAASPPLRAEAPAAPVLPRSLAASRSPAPVRAAAAARRPVDEGSRTPELPAQKSRRAIVSSGAAKAVPAAMAAAPFSIPPAPVMSAPAAMPTPTPAGSEAPSVAAPVSVMPPPGIPAVFPVAPPEPVSAVSASASEPEETPPADGRVFGLAELPAAISAELPKLLVSGHVWSEEPSMRLLSVDDRLLREGSEAAPGVSLQEITPEGAVFVFKGWRFRVAGRRP